MSRPEHYCAKCGEFVALKWTTTSGDRWVERWVHISADGVTLFRTHAAVLENSESSH